MLAQGDIDIIFAHAQRGLFCVCVCFRGPHLQPTQLSDKVGILAVSVSCSLVFEKGVFRIIASFRR